MKNKRKICFFSGNIERSGGTERVGTIIANELTNRGYEVVILSYEGGKKSYFELDDRIKLYTLMNNMNINKFKKQYYPTYLLNKFIKEKNIDIIIDIDIILSTYTIPLKLFSNIKIISWEHFNLSSNNGVKKRDYARKLASKFSNKIITLNKEDMYAYKKKFPKSTNIDYIYNPSPFRQKQLNCNKSKKIALSVGRLTKQKGFDLLLKSWKYIQDDYGDWQLHIVGSGEEYKTLVSIIEKLNIRNVKILPFSSNIVQHYTKASMYIMSSRYEGFPMVLLEAKSCGLPIISFDCKTGPREIIKNGVDGILVEDGNCKSLASAISELMGNNDELKQFSKNAYEDSKNYTPKIAGAKWEAIIESI